MKTINSNCKVCGGASKLIIKEMDYDAWLRTC